MKIKKKEILKLIEIFGLHVICDSWRDGGYLKIHWDKSMDSCLSFNVQIITKLIDDTEDKVCEKLRHYLIERGHYMFKLEIMKTIGKTSPELHCKDRKKLFM